ncbi:MAG TPA: HEAT repeat domain-containing protein [Myxococcales bacterium]|jgi:HEAT repeat protein
MTAPAREDPLRAKLARLDRVAAGQEPTAILEEALGDESLVVRARAASVAAAQLDPRRLVLLVAQGSSLARRSGAMDALVRAGPRALPAVLAGSQSGQRDEVRFCLQVLGRVDAPEARAALRRAAAHPDRELRQTAFEALGVQKDPEAVPMLLGALEGDPWAAFAAIWALGEIGDRRAVAALRDLHGQELFQEAIEAALVRIERPSAAGGAANA